MTITLDLPGDEPVEIDPRSGFVRLARGSAFVSVPLRNVGRGLAVIDEAGVSSRGHTLGSMQKAVVRRVRLPVAETARITVRAVYRLVAEQRLTTDDRWVILVPYTDFAERHRTVVAFSIACPPEGPDGTCASWMFRTRRRSFVVYRSLSEVMPAGPNTVGRRRTPHTPGGPRPRTHDHSAAGVIRSYALQPEPTRA
jgi:hypothetical protein